MAFTWANPKYAAVLPFSTGSGLDSNVAQIIAERFQTELLSQGDYSLIDRQQISAILAEQGFQNSGVCSKSDCSVEIGQLLGAEILFTGSVSQIGKLMTLNIRKVDVATGRIIAQHAIDSKGGIEDVLTIACKQMAEYYAVKKATPSTTSTPKQASSTPTPAIEEKKSNTWLWVTGGALATAAGVTAFLLLNSQTTTDTVATRRGF